MGLPDAVRVGWPVRRLKPHCTHIIARGASETPQPGQAMLAGPAGAGGAGGTAGTVEILGTTIDAWHVGQVISIPQ